MTKAQYIVEALRAASEVADTLRPGETRRLLRDAAEVIETLSTLVGIREGLEAEAELEATPPAGLA